MRTPIGRLTSRLPALRLLSPRQLRGWRLVALFTVASALAAAAGTTLVRSNHLGLVIGLILAAGILVGHFILTGFRPIWTTAACLLGFFLVLAGMLEAGPTILQLRGERIEANVLDLRVSAEKSDRYHYSLVVVTAGRVLQGELTLPEQAYAKGDPVTVIEDPVGLAHPMRPREVAEHRDSRLAVIVLYLIVAALSLLAGRPRPSRDPHPGTRTRKWFSRTGRDVDHGTAEAAD